MKRTIFRILLSLLILLSFVFSFCSRQRDSLGSKVTSISSVENAISSDASQTVKKIENNRDELDSLTNEAKSSQEFYIMEITDDILSRIQGKSYPSGCPVSLDSLRYVHVLHVNNEGETKVGELIVNEQIATDVLEIFKELYNQKYPIEKIRLIDEYNADDESSMRDNNSSAFCYRTISGSNKISKHGYGLAVDINTLYNPYVKTNSDGSYFLQPQTAKDYINRNNSYPYKIEKNDLCYDLFIQHGFKWGGDWNNPKDYQHFEK